MSDIIEENEILDEEDSLEDFAWAEDDDEDDDEDNVSSDPGYDVVPTNALVTHLDTQIPAFWGGAESAWFESVRKTQLIRNSKHGMLADVPIICRGKTCPYDEACYIDKTERVEGTRCPIEVGTIIDLHRRYCAQMGINPDDVDPARHTVDISLINELIELEIKLMRTQKLLAIDADFVQEVVAEVDREGNAYTKPELHQAEQFAERIRKDIHKIMDMLLGTRKSKKAAGLGQDPSSKAASLMAQAKQLAEEGKMDQGVVGFFFKPGSEQTPEALMDAADVDQDVDIETP